VIIVPTTLLAITVHLIQSKGRGIVCPKLATIQPARPVEVTILSAVFVRMATSGRTVAV